MLTRETLMQHLWPDTIVTDTSLTQNIWLLRKALNDDQESPAALYRDMVCHDEAYGFVASVSICPC